MSFQESAAYIRKHGLARTNRFRVLIPIPQKLLADTVSKDEDKSKLAESLGNVVKVIKIFAGSSSSDIARGLDVMCNQTELPGKTINLSETKYNGDVLKSGHSIMYAQQQFTFKVSRDMHEKNIIDAWSNMIVNPETHEVGYLEDYAVSINIFQLDSQDRIVHGIKLEDAFPVLTNPLTLSNTEMNNVHELMAQFAYRRWSNIELEDIVSGTATSSLMQTPLGPYLAPILSNPAIQRALEYVKDVSGLDLEGEAVNIYNQIDKVVSQVTGDSINKTISILIQMKSAIKHNSRITDNQIAQLIDFIDGILSRIE